MRLNILLFFLLFLNTLAAQDIIFVRNNSFEANKPRQSVVPRQWFNCADLKLSPPDLHSKRSRFFRVKNHPQDGKIYLGLIVRDDSTFESIGQELSQPLQQHTNYKFSLYAARSEKYESYSRTSTKLESFTQPAILRVWGSNNRCEPQELLAESVLITEQTWKQFTFQIRPTKSDYKFLILEAYYSSSSNQPYNGHILLDNLSNLEVHKD